MIFYKCKSKDMKPSFFQRGGSQTGECVKTPVVEWSESPGVLKCVLY